jgi:hypothetical protein
MVDRFEAQIVLPSGANAPDAWDHGHGVVLRLDAVISRDDEGSTLSCAGDFVWQWKPYTARGNTANLSFFFWNKQSNRQVGVNEFTERRLALIRELQYLMVLRVYHSEQLLSFGTLKGELSALRNFAIFAEENGSSLRGLLEKPLLLDAYIGKATDSQCLDVVRWLNFLRQLDPVSQLGFKLVEPKKWAALKKRSNDYIKKRRQTAPLPTRIYLELINALSRELDDIEAHRDRLLAALREGLVLHRDYRASGSKWGSGFGRELIAAYGLGDFLSRRDFEESLRGLTSALANIQRICKLQVHTFSGMRDEEAEYLPYHCMESVKAGHGRTHCLISGITTKLAGARRKRTRWVTTEAQGFRALRLAQAFADVIYESIGVKPRTAEIAKDDFPLFVAVGYLPWSNAKKRPVETRFMPNQSLALLWMSNSLKTALCPIIQAQDLEELEAIEPFRDWNNEPEFAIGKRWNIKSHQLRRSLALYANASGLVRTSSLKRQLQHLTREMAEYYGRGSVFAKNFLSHDPREYRKHICRDWQDTEQEAQALAFTRDVLNSDEPLYGPGGAFYELKKQRGEVMSRQEVKEQIRRGRLSYKAHPLGGCTHVGVCDKQKGLRLTSGICISESCRSLIGKHSSILKIIPIQRGIVANLDPNSIAYQMEKEELDILEVAEVHWQPSNRPSTGLLGGIHV